MGVVGDLNRYMQFNAAEGMAQPGSAMGAAMGAGMGAGLGMGMAQNMGPWGANPGMVPPAPSQTSAVPPAPPQASPDTVWHIADNGQTSGPFSTAAMGRKVNDGSLTRETMVWTPGQDGWKPAGEVTPLARLFTIQPPPPPGS
jgi:hypothetical protein